MNLLVLASVLLFSQIAESDVPARFVLYGTIAEEGRVSDTRPVSMIFDMEERRILFIRLNQRLPGTSMKLVQVDRKWVEFSDGDQRLRLFRDAWEGNSFRTAIIDNKDTAQRRR